MLAAVARAWNADSIVYLALQEMMRLFKVDADLRSKAVSVMPRRFLESVVVMPILRKTVGCTSGQQTAPVVQSIVLAVCGRSFRTFAGWLLPSRERLMIRYGLRPTEWRCRYIVRYYLDMLREMVSVVVNLGFGAKKD